MSFPLKVLLTLLSLLVATVVGAAVWITLIFDPNDYRDDIAEAVRENTGRELRLEGPLKLRLFPQVAVEVNTLALANAKDFGPEPMLEVGRLLASVEVLPLLLDQAVRIGEIRLEQVRARIETRGERNNWEDIAEAQQEQAEAEDIPEEESVELEVDSQGEAPDLRIEAILLQDISLIYIQDGAQTTLQLD
ncbi:MAG: AsmA family protein, partial [Oceanococcaceae bacterium]